jgi:hypothetical protein
MKKTGLDKKTWTKDKKKKNQEEENEEDKEKNNLLFVGYIR